MPRILMMILMTFLELIHLVFNIKEALKLTLVQRTTC